VPTYGWSSSVPRFPENLFCFTPRSCIYSRKGETTQLVVLHEPSNTHNTCTRSPACQQVFIQSHSFSGGLVGFGQNTTPSSLVHSLVTQNPSQQHLTSSVVVCGNGTLRDRRIPAAVDLRVDAGGATGAGDCRHEAAAWSWRGDSNSRPPHYENNARLMQISALRCKQTTCERAKIANNCK